MPKEKPKENKARYVLKELAQHLPFSIFGVSVGIILMGILTFFAILLQAEHLLPTASEELFHIFHPSHVLFSAVATTAMFWKHERNLLKAIMVGFIGSIVICSLSDVFFPFIGGLMLGADMHVHVCVLEEPQLVYPFAIIGVMGGLLVTNTFERSTEFSHSAHVLVSSMASILYLLSFGFSDWIHALGSVFIITIIAVMIPCCASDIALPLACVHKNCDHP
jgi:hypothetical protein